MRRASNDLPVILHPGEGEGTKPHRGGSGVTSWTAMLVGDDVMAQRGLMGCSATTTSSTPKVVHAQAGGNSVVGEVRLRRGLSP